MNTITWVGVGLYDGMLPDAIAGVELAAAIPALERAEKYLATIAYDLHEQYLRAECEGHWDDTAAIGEAIDTTRRRLEAVRNVLRSARDL